MGAWSKKLSTNICDYLFCFSNLMTEMFGKVDREEIAVDKNIIQYQTLSEIWSFFFPPSELIGTVRT